ncbi:TPA: hypothetical protein ACI4S8_001419 [Klebsiella quasipneumoniae]
MTKSTITRERLEKIAAGRVDARRCNDDEIAMAITLLAAMDSEPVAYMVRRHDEHEGTGTLIHAEYLQRYQDRGDYHYTALSPRAAGAGN